MELARQHGLQSRIPQLSISLPLYVRFILGLSLSMVILVADVLLLHPLSQPPANPFSAYADLLPGQMAVDLAARGFACREQNTGSTRYEQTRFSVFCTYRPPTGIFEHIAVMLSGDQAVTLVVFTVRDDRLVLGDLALLLGRPPIMAAGGDMMTFDWLDSEWSILANTRRGSFSYFMPLHRVTFIAA